MTEPIENCVSFLVGKTAQQVTRRSRDELAPHGVTPVQYAVLNVLWERDGQSLAEIGTRLVLDSATMTGVVDRLEGAQLVTRQADPDGDRRVSRVLLTLRGHALEEPLQAAMDKVNREIADELGSGARRFWAALRQLGCVEPPAVAVKGKPGAKRSSSAAALRRKTNHG